ncbi:MAG: S8 family serine peptidase [Planctomycetes bacterium]|nr:S8 family serine peptidase [Planctomycetota bacterium]
MLQDPAQCEAVSTVAHSPKIEPLASQLPGLEQLWARTSGDPRICIAVLDGPVDLTHPSLREAAITQINLDEVKDSGTTALSDHGTHVTSIIFGSHDGPVKGIAPNCRGLIIPIFRYASNGSLEPCSQQRLAKAIRAAVRFGANVINISAGQFTSRGESSPELREAIEECGEDVLIVSAAGNDGCDCLHVPGALPSVLAVGAMNSEGRPLPFSNWGEAYQEQGVLAPGEKILGAAGDGGVRAQSGTSFSTPIVSGVAGLLLSLQQQLGTVPSSKSIRNAILETTHGCDPQTETQCERVLAGRLSISGSVSVVTQGTNIMQNAPNGPAPADVVVPPSVDSATSEPGQATPSAAESVEASACCGGCAGTNKQLVYAIGELCYDFPSVLRESSLQQNMDPLDAVTRHVPLARNPIDFLRHLFGYEEILVSDMNVGHIDGLVAKDAIYQLEIQRNPHNFTFKLCYAGQTTLELPALATAQAIEDALATFTGLEGKVHVTENDTKGHPKRDLEIEFDRGVPQGKLTVTDVDPKRTTVNYIGQLRLTSSDGAMTDEDLGRQVGFSGIGIGKGHLHEPSLLNQATWMRVRHIHTPHGGKQAVYVETSVLDESSEFTLREAHWYVPHVCEAKSTHRPNMYDAGAVIWKLNRGQMEVYGITPDGTFAEECYKELAEFYLSQSGLTHLGLNYYYYDGGGRNLPWDFGWDPSFNSKSDGSNYQNSEGGGKPLVQERAERVAIPGHL